MPICILLVPEAASQEAKLALMGRLSSHIHEAYPVTTTHIFVRETSGSDMMLAGSLVSDLRTTDTGTRGARVCFLICPPGVKADAKKAMMEKLTADISDVYPGSDDVFIIHREDAPANVMLICSRKTRSSGRLLPHDIVRECQLGARTIRYA